MAEGKLHLNHDFCLSVCLVNNVIRYERMPVSVISLISQLHTFLKQL